MMSDTSISRVIGHTVSDMWKIQYFLEKIQVYEFICIFHSPTMDKYKAYGWEDGKNHIILAPGSIPPNAAQGSASLLYG